VVSGAGFSVDPAELQKFSQFLSGTTQPAVQDAANRMQAVNGFDSAAFGILLAQILAVPSRITMAVITGEITKLVGTSAWYAPGAAVVEMVEAILLDKKKILPCSVYLQGEYGVRDLFVGVPCKLGARGLEQIIQIKLTPDEDAAFKKSAAAVKELVTVINV